MWRSDPGLNGFVTKDHPLEARPLRISLGPNETELDISGVTREHVWEFSSAESGVFPLVVSFSWKGDLILSWVSLMPRDNLKGWRRDVVEKVREAGPTVVRFPGGCFTSFFNWRSSVDPRDRREPQESFYWGGLEEYDVGLREFMELAELCGFEPQICFNMMTSTPFDAMCMAEYLNAPPTGDTDGFAPWTGCLPPGVRHTSRKRKSRCAVPFRRSGTGKPFFRGFRWRSSHKRDWPEKGGPKVTRYLSDCSPTPPCVPIGT